MSVVIIGCGSVECMIAKKLLEDNIKIYVIGKWVNPYLYKIAEDYLQYDDNIDIIEWITDKQVDYSILGDNNEYNIDDNNLKILGLSHINKSRNINIHILCEHDLSRYIPYSIFLERYDYENVKKILQLLNYNVVIKPIKRDNMGIKIYNILDKPDIYNHCNNILLHNNTILVQERLDGKEFILSSLTDGNTVKHLVPVITYNNLKEDGLGDIVKCMGTISYKDPFLDDSNLNICYKINKKLIEIFKIKGLLSCKYILTSDNTVRLVSIKNNINIESLINNLELLNTSLYWIFKYVLDGMLDKIDIKLEKNDTLCKYVVPLNYLVGNNIDNNIIIQNVNDDNILFEHCYNDSISYKTLGNRILV